MEFEYETPRLILKIIKPEEAEQVLDFYLRDQALFEQYEPARFPGFYTVEKQKQMAKYEYNASVKGMAYRYYVYRKEQPGQIIGTISFHDIRWGCFSSCEIGYKFSSEFHRRGYATEALSEIVYEIFTDLKLHRVTAWVLPDNEASTRLLRKVGFCYEGISRDYMFLQGRWRDHARYCMINPY